MLGRPCRQIEGYFRAVPAGTRSYPPPSKRHDQGCRWTLHQRYNSASKARKSPLRRTFGRTATRAFPAHARAPSLSHDTFPMRRHFVALLAGLFTVPRHTIADLNGPEKVVAAILGCTFGVKIRLAGASSIGSTHRGGKGQLSMRANSKRIQGHKIYFKFY